MLQRLDLTRRARAALIHLLISGMIAALAASLVLSIWYPGMYQILSGGREIFILLISIDVALGPALTFAVFDRSKSLLTLRRDLAAIGVMQLIALTYGLYTAYQARPVATVFEVDRFRVVTAAQVYLPDFPKAPKEYQMLPKGGPLLLGTRAPKNSAEMNDALFTAIEKGVDIGQRPAFWQPYSASIPDVIARARPLSFLLSNRPETRDDVHRALRLKNLEEASVKFLPLMARGGDWVVLIDGAGRLVHYVKADGFF